MRDGGAGLVSDVDVRAERAASNARRFGPSTNGQGTNGQGSAPTEPIDWDGWCLDRLRKEPDVVYGAVVAIAVGLGWDQPEHSFRVGPWRRAKMAERKERTGTPWRKPHPGPKRRDVVVAPSPEPAVSSAPPVEPALNPALPVIDYRTSAGTLLVRPEGSAFRVIYHVALDRTTVEHLLPLLTAMMQAGVLVDA